MIDFASDFFGIDSEDIKRKNREPDILRARFIIVDYLIRLKKYSLVCIGKAIQRNHASIINVKKRIGVFIKNNPDMEQDINEFNEWMSSKMYEAQ
jgi:chromosomal replication initiation ATPase DnaA